MDDGLDPRLLSAVADRARIGDLEKAGSILVWGPDLKEEHPTLYLRVRRAAQELGAGLVVIHPRRTGLDDRASAKVTYRPGYRRGGAGRTGGGRGEDGRSETDPVRGSGGCPAGQDRVRGEPRPGRGGRGVRPHPARRVHPAAGPPRQRLRRPGHGPKSHLAAGPGAAGHAGRPDAGRPVGGDTHPLRQGLPGHPGGPGVRGDRGPGADGRRPGAGRARRGPGPPGPGERRPGGGDRPVPSPTVPGWRTWCPGDGFRRGGRHRHQHREPGAQGEPGDARAGPEPGRLGDTFRSGRPGWGWTWEWSRPSRSAGR